MYANIFLYDCTHDASQMYNNYFQLAISMLPHFYNIMSWRNRLTVIATFRDLKKHDSMPSTIIYYTNVVNPTS